jgi:hypothetical protein
VSSILPGSTRKALQNRLFLSRALPFPPRFNPERIVKFPHKLGENQGKVFAGCSRAPKAFRLQDVPAAGAPRPQSESAFVTAE